MRKRVDPEKVVEGSSRDDGASREFWAAPGRVVGTQEPRNRSMGPIHENALESSVSGRIGPMRASMGATFVANVEKEGILPQTLRELNVPLEDVRHLTGHADPRTARQYGRRKRRRSKVSRNLVERILI